MKDDLVYIKHIREALGKVKDYLGDHDLESFSKDNKTVDAVVRQLGVIGEAANNLSDNFKTKNPELPYKEMIAMRNFVIHEYFGVNEKVVWDTCHEDLPKLKEYILKF